MGVGHIGSLKKILLTLTCSYHTADRLQGGDETAISLSRLTLRKEICHKLSFLKYPASKNASSIELTQVILLGDLQSGVSGCDYTSIYHCDGTKYWLSVTHSEE